MFEEKKMVLVRQFLGSLPHFAALEMELLEMDVGYCRMQMPYHAAIVGDPDTGCVHGGVVTTLLDSVGGLCVFAQLQRMQPVATLDLRIDYLKPATLRSHLIAEARVERMTRTVAFVSGVAYQDRPESPIARATASFFLEGAGARPELSGTTEVPS